MFGSRWTCGSCDARELAVDAWGGRGFLRGPHRPYVKATQRRMRPDDEEWWRRQHELWRERVLAQEKLKGRQGINVAADCEALDTWKRPVASEVLQCFHFGEKRGRGSAHFRRGKKHVGRLLVPVRKGDRRI
jgi:hypothetical protein